MSVVNAIQYLASPMILYYNNWKEIFSIYVATWNDKGPESLDLDGWKNFISREYNIIFKICNLDREFIVWTIIIAIIITISRHILQPTIINKIPIWLKLNQESIDKMPECIWRLTFYTLAWLYTFKVMCFSDYPLLDNHHYIWRTVYGPAAPVPHDVYIAYLMQCAFYIHSVYGNIVLDVQRADFRALMLHHVVTLSLLLFSYAARYHNCGMVIIFLHDVCDIFLELAKCFNYNIFRNGVKNVRAESFSLMMFIIFTILWIWLRLYWFQTKLLYSSCVTSLLEFPDADFHLELNALLFILYGLNLYWTFFILLVIWDSLLGKEKQDSREKHIKKSV